MIVSRYGFDVLTKVFLSVAVVIVCVFLFVNTAPVRYLIIVLMMAVFLFAVNFFRDPERTSPNDPGNVISPADGKIVLIKDVFEPEYLQSEAIQLSIFMSPLDVHVNRFPMSGTVRYFKYIPGEYIVAFDDKSSDRNERTHIGLENGEYKIFFKQIAGTIARRIVAEVTVGQKVQCGERFGMIKFGSRIDVLMPKGTNLNVHLDDRVIAGETILAIKPSAV